MKSGPGFLPATNQANRARAETRRQAVKRARVRTTTAEPVVVRVPLT